MSDVPDPPANMPAFEARLWRTLAPDLVRLGLYQPAFDPLLRLTISATGSYFRMRQELRAFRAAHPRADMRVRERQLARTRRAALLLLSDFNLVPNPYATPRPRLADRQFVAMVEIRRLDELFRIDSPDEDGA